MITPVWFIEHLIELVFLLAIFFVCCLVNMQHKATLQTDNGIFMRQK